MNLSAQPVASDTIADLREQHWTEVNAQVVHALLFRRPGWLEEWSLQAEGARCGFAALAVGGPWQGRRTLVEFFVVPEVRRHAVALFAAFQAASGASSFELQTNCDVQGILPHLPGTDVRREKIVFGDGVAPSAPDNGAALFPLTASREIQTAIAERNGGGEWAVVLNGETVARGGLLFHYNRPYGDVWMEVAESHRRRGLGTWLVQRLMHECRSLGEVPAARCDGNNMASCRTLQGAGFVPVGHILTGNLRGKPAT